LGAEVGHEFEAAEGEVLGDGGAGDGGVGEEAQRGGGDEDEGEARGDDDGLADAYALADGFLAVGAGEACAALGAGDGAGVDADEVEAAPGALGVVVDFAAASAEEDEEDAEDEEGEEGEDDPGAHGVGYGGRGGCKREVGGVERGPEARSAGGSFLGDQL